MKSYEAERRSTRIRAQIPFRLASLDPAIPFSEHCHTLVVNTEGCGVRLTRPLEPGLPVLLDELPGGTSAPARVASCVPLGTGGKYWLVGLALDEPGNIWCIQPAPADWGIESKPVLAAVLRRRKRTSGPTRCFPAREKRIREGSSGPYVFRRSPDCRQRAKAIPEQNPYSFESRYRSAEIRLAVELFVIAVVVEGWWNSGRIPECDAF